MGPLGRISWTLGMALVTAFCCFSGDIFAIVACLFVAPVVLRSVWAKARIVQRRAT
jgi:hypothetical protein